MARRWAPECRRRWPPYVAITVRLTCECAGGGGPGGVVTRGFLLLLHPFEHDDGLEVGGAESRWFVGRRVRGEDGRVFEDIEIETGWGSIHRRRTRPRWYVIRGPRNR